jgi:hypothetical protein
MVPLSTLYNSRMEARYSFLLITLSDTSNESSTKPNRRGDTAVESPFARGAFSPGKERFKLLNTITATINMAISEKAMPQSLCVNIYVICRFARRLLNAKTMPGPV